MGVLAKFFLAGMSMLYTGQTVYLAGNQCTAGGHCATNVVYAGYGLNTQQCINQAGANGTCVLPVNYTETVTTPISTSAAKIKIIGMQGSMLTGVGSITVLTITGAGTVIDGINITAGVAGSALNMNTSDNMIVKNTNLICYAYCINATDINNLWLDGNTETTIAGYGANGVFYQNTSKATVGLKVTNNTANINGSGEGILVHNNNTTYVANDIDIENNKAYMNNTNACFGIEVGNFGGTLFPSGGRIAGNITVLGANENCGGISLSSQNNLTVVGNTLDANGYNYGIEGVEVTQGSSYNTVVGNQVINAPSTNIGGVVDVNGGSFNKIIGNSGTNVAALYVGYSGHVNSNNNLIAFNSITLGALGSTKGILYMQCNENSTGGSNTCNNNIFTDNTLVSNSTTNACLIAESDGYGTQPYPGIVANNTFERNDCSGFTGTWYLLSTVNGSADVTGTVLIGNIAESGGTVQEIYDTSGNAVIQAEDVGFKAFKRVVQETAGSQISTLSSAPCLSTDSSGNIQSGCSGLGSVGSGTTGQIPYYPTNGNSVSGTSTLPSTITVGTPTTTNQPTPKNYVDSAIAAASPSAGEGHILVGSGSIGYDDSGVNIDTVPFVLYATTPSLGGSALAAGACSSTTVAVTGSAGGHTVTMTTSDGSDIGGNYFYRATVTTPGTITAWVCAIVAGIPATKTYVVATY